MRSFLNKALLSLGLLFGGSFLFAEQISVTSFKGLNNNENAAIIEPNYASDLLNVDVSEGGKSVLKRPGYGVYKDLDVGGIHGGHHSFDSTGNDVQIWGSSVSLWGIVADGTPTQLVSSATLNSTWDCTDTQGFNYCVNSNRNAYIRTDGATISWYTSPLGTMVESTPDRVVVAGVSGSPNTLFVSQSNIFTNFVTGTNATDAFTEVIASPGSKITHIRWGCAKLLWWKDQSMGYFDFEDQFVAQVKTVSTNIGTFDNTSAVDPGGNIWFRGQDGHIYKYDCSGISKESIDITPLVQTSGNRTSNSFTQTTQSDFSSGSSVPTGNLSAIVSPGDLTVSSFGVTINVSSTIAVSPDVLNNSFELGSGSFDATYWGTFSPWVRGTGFTGNNCGAITATNGTYMISNSLGASNTEWGLYNAATNVLISSTVLNTSAQACSWTVGTLTGAAAAGVSVKLKIGGTVISDAFTANGNNISIRYVADNCGAAWCKGFDYVTGSPVLTVSSVTTTSSVYDTALTSPIAQMQGLWSATISTANFTLFTSSASNGVFTAVTNSTGTNVWASRYLKVSSTVSFPSNGVISSSVTIVARSTGTYYSPVRNAPLLSAWSTFNPTSQLNDGNITYAIRVATQPFTVLSSTPAVYTTLIPGSLVTASTGTYFQILATFTITAATHTPTLSDFVVNWFEGNASDQAYMLYFDDDIYTSVAYGAGVSSNTYIFKRDLVNEGWTVYNFGAGGMLIQNNSLYFGEVGDGGNIFKFGSGTSDNGATINAYWKSKVFTGNDPFLQNSLTNIDSFYKADTGSTLTATYELDTSTSTSYSIALSTAANIIQNRKLLPGGKLGYGFSYRVGDNSASSNWEMFGYRIGFNTNPYRPTQ